jgi:hypothetical protein
MPAYYRATVAKFLADDPARVLGDLAGRSELEGFTDLKQRQIRAWKKQIAALSLSLAELTQGVPSSEQWGLLLEYPIPRRQKRIDAVLLAADVIIVLEFKTEDKDFKAQPRQQAEDYALDLRDFHEESRGRAIVPTAVALQAEAEWPGSAQVTSDAVRPTIASSAAQLAAVIKQAAAAETSGGAQLDLVRWDTSAYRPVPTIIEAAEALFAGHDVREIAHSAAGDENLSLTSDRLIDIIREAQEKKLKVACFVTGVPGAGKTLVGLNVVHNPALKQDGRAAGVFLSGNGPLVKIVSASIERDSRRRAREGGAERVVGTFIQNVHSFTRAAFDKPDEPPAENVVIFDEAQRAWNLEQSRKKTGREKSETESMLEIMDRHADWAVLIALVGGGQEINTGEAGLAEWGRVLVESFAHWIVAVSPEALNGDASVAGSRLFEASGPANITVHEEPALHLAVNRRAYRAQELTEWINAVLNEKPAEARELAAQLGDFPLVITRDLNVARSWLREHTRGLRRCGLLASSGAVRLRADGLELSSGFRQGNRDLYVNWFLNLPPDVRSSNQLEVAASEYECQGLELDWVGVCWGGDFLFRPLDGWQCQQLSGSKWQAMRSQIDRAYLLNTYRVLLTRAREGVIIWILVGIVMISPGCPISSIRLLTISARVACPN